ncbi:hypothetical protein FHS85_003732 [Rhodoligotrophos appendicifer]|uniref:SGNH/GDSL hydrolase family protein n=1 Tax=Rhodoligotrophos appendicifer TaxID=987056 RepID=UPI00118637DC|nr:DUF459 domain-containing protein [Rhodoligotrophos appendicifer]
MGPMHRCVSFILLAMLAVAAPAMAQTASKPPVTETQAAADGKHKAPGATYIPEAHDRYTVLVIGDNMAGGLWAGMGRVLAGEEKLQLEGRYREGSGFARADLYDWVAALPGILDRNQVHTAVVLVGSNDGQDMRVGDKRIPFGSPEWQTAYEKVVDAFLTEMKRRSIAVYWVSLPPMARAEYDSAMQKINGVVKARAEKLGVKFIDIRKDFSDEDGRYTEMGVTPDDGVMRRLRDRDGVNFLKRGNDKMASLVLDVIREDIKTAEDPAVAAAQTLAAQGETGATDYANNLPLFGQPGVNAPIMIRPEVPKNYRPNATTMDAGIAMVVDLDAPGGEEGLLQLQETAAPDTAAAKLFAQGIPPAPKPGRADDFAWQKSAP